MDQLVAALAGEAHGVVTRAELLAAGVSPRMIHVRLVRGSLIPVYAGVYLAGHGAPSIEARYMAAVKACGRHAALSGHASAHLWKLVPRVPALPEVTTPDDRDIPGIRTHRWRPRRRDEDEALPVYPRTVHRGIPVATVPRTLAEIAGALSDSALARACHEANVLYRVTPSQVAQVLRITPRIRGARRLRTVLNGDTPVTLSVLEERFLAQLGRRGLPLPVTNHLAGGRRVDCRWPQHRLTVELDSYRFHNSRHAWEADRRREREARDRSDEFRRYTYGDVVDDPEPMMRDLARLLARPAPH